MVLSGNKKITFLISSIAGGGAEGVCVNIANALTERGWQVTLVVLHLNNSVYHTRINNKVELVVLGVNHARFAFFPLLRFLKKRRPEIILSFNNELAILLVIIRAVAGLKIRIIVRNINTLSYSLKADGHLWLKKATQLLVRHLYLKVDYVINQSSGMQKDLFSHFSVSRSFSTVIHNPVNKIISDAVMDIRYEGLKKESYFLCVGRLENQKAFHYAIHAFSMIAKDYPAFRLKIVGKGSLEDDLKCYAKSLGIAHLVDFEGFQKDMVPYYLKARATVLTSLYEGFPNILIESITLGTPVLAFDCQSGPSEIIINGVNGYLLPYQDTESLSAYMKSIIENPLDPEVIKRTAEKYNIDEIVEQYATFLV